MQKGLITTHYKFKNTLAEVAKRQRLIDYIEGHIGTMKNMPWNEIPTEEIEQLSDGIATLVYESIMSDRGR